MKPKSKILNKRKFFIYNKSYYKQYEAGFKSINRPDHQRILDLCHFKRKDKVLEIGCGYGILLKKIKSNYKIGIETNKYVVNYCRSLGLNVILNSSVINIINFQDDYFDYVIMNEVLEHLLCPEKIVKECNRVLKQGGRIIITTTAKNLLNKNVDPSHVSEMTIAELKTLLQKNNFKIIRHEVSGINFMTFFLDRIIFRFARLLRKKGKGGLNSMVGSVQNQFDQFFLVRWLSHFRNNYLSWGTTQLVIAKKEK